MRSSPPWLLLAELLVAPCEAMLQEEIYDLVNKPLFWEQSLHAFAVDGLFILAGKYLPGQAYALFGGPIDHTLFLSCQGNQQIL